MKKILNNSNIIKFCPLWMNKKYSITKIYMSISCYHYVSTIWLMLPTQMEEVSLPHFMDNIII